MSQNQVFCPSCGAAVTPGVQFCRTCGKPIPAEGARPPGTPVPSSTPPVVLPAVPLPAPVPGAAAVPSRKGSPTLLFVIGGLALVCVCLVCGIGAIAILSHPDAVQIGIEGGKVSLEGGAEVEVPAGAVQANADGTAQKVSVTIKKDPSQTPSLPRDFVSVGPVYQLGPEGVAFAVPVRITLPIPDGADPARVMGLTTLDNATGKWVGVPGAVDAKARTVTAGATHLSFWGIYGAETSWNAAAWGGWIKIVNTHVRSSDPYPGCMTKPQATEIGVCFQTYTVANPLALVAFITPRFNMVLARDAQTQTYWLPSGTYTLQEWQMGSEINQDPLYLPCCKTYVRPTETVVITPGVTIVFGQDEQQRTLPTPGPFVAGHPINCPGGVCSPEQQPGVIKIVNSYTRGSENFPVIPGCRGLPITREYGVCIITYTPDDPWALIRPTCDLILAKDGQTTTYPLPAGTYTLQEWRMDSEINQGDPLYSPCYKTYVRPPETIVIKPRMTIVFGDELKRTLPTPGPFVEGKTINPKCAECAATTHAATPTRTRTPVATATKTTTATPTKTSTPVTPIPPPAAGLWTLTKTTPIISQGKDDNCYFSHKVAVSSGSFTSSGSWHAGTKVGCMYGETVSGSDSTTVTWTPPPAQLNPGDKLTLSGSTKVTAQGTWADQTFSGVSVLRMTKAKNCLGCVMAGSLYFFEMRVEGRYSSLSNSDSKSGTIQIPSGSSGDELDIGFHGWGRGGHAIFSYTYVYGP